MKPARVSGGGAPHHPRPDGAAVGADFEVVEPPELLDYVRRMAAQFTRASR
jgi:hypothetical protein